MTTLASSVSDAPNCGMAFIDDVRVVIYDHNMFMTQAIGWKRVTVTSTLAY
jgi:hypothetical protein